MGSKRFRLSAIEQWDLDESAAIDNEIVRGLDTIHSGETADGAQRFQAAVERALRDPDGLRWWYLSVIDRLADEGLVETCSIEGLRWAEVDFPRDLDAARAVVAA